MEIFNGSDDTVDLSGYAFPSVTNAPSIPGVYESWNTFTEDAQLAPGDVYVICHGSSDELILDHCDQTHNSVSNGDDGFALVKGTEDNYQIVDMIGNWEGDPGSGWDVAGVSDATKDHTLVRKCGITTGNAGNWEESAGATAADSEWIVYDQNTWDYLGAHECEDTEDTQWLELGETCQDSALSCGTGLSCCNPCGAPPTPENPCEPTCVETCDDSEPSGACMGGCWLYP